MKKTLAIVILTWNDYNNTIKCIKSVASQLDKNEKIFLIDNNSKIPIFEKTIKWIKKNYKNKLCNKTFFKIKKISKKTFK